MDNTELIIALNKQLPATLPHGASHDEMLNKLSEYLNLLILHDFQKLVFILYKTDVNENKLKQLLRLNSNEDAALVIAKLIVEREVQKTNSRNRTVNKNDISGEERW